MLAAVLGTSLIGAEARLGHAASATISHEGSASFTAYGTSDSQPVTVPAVGNAVLLFQFAGKVGADALSSVTYGGQPLTLLTARSQGSVRLEVWYLLNPPAGTKPLAWQKTGTAQNVTWGASVYSGVDQTAAFGSVAQAGATQDGAGAKSVTVASAAGELVVDAVVANGGSTASGPTGAAGQDVRWTNHISTTEGGSSSKPGAASVTVGWTPSVIAGIDWALIGVPLKPASAPPPSPQVPVVVDRPVVSGTAAQGETLQTSNGTWSNNPTSFAYKWRRCTAADPAVCTVISGATAQSYTLTTDDVGSKIRSQVVATNVAGDSAPADSDPTATVTGPPQPSPIAHAASVSFSTYGTSDARAVAVPASTNGVLVFQFAGKSGSDQLSSVSYGGAPLTRLAVRSQGSVRLELWYLLAPPAGTASLAWQKTGAAQNVTWGASVYSGVDQSTPFDPAAQTGATGDASGAAKTLSVDAVAGEVVVDAIVLNGGPTPSGPTAGGGQAQRWSTSISTTQGGSSSKPAASPVTMSWTPAGSGSWDWALVAAPLRPATGAPPAVSKPVNTGLPVVSGNAVVGQTLSTTDGTWSNSPTGFTYKWKQCDATGANCTPIAGAVGNQYTLVGTDQGFRIRSEVVASNAAGPSAPASSEPSATVAAAPAPSPVTHIATASFSAYGTSDSQPVALPSVSDGILVFVFAGKLGADQLTAVTYGGAALTRLASRSQGSVRLELWYLLSPPAGTRQLTWTKSGAAQNVTWGASLYSGVNQSTPFDGSAQAGATGDPASAKTLVVPASPNELVVDAVVFNGGAATAGPLPGAGQTARFSRRQSTTQGGSSTKPSASPVTVSWTPNGTGTFDWAIIGAPLRAAQPNQPPTDIALSSSTVGEHLPSGTTVGTLTTTDADSGETFAYTLQTSGCAGTFPDNASFQIAGDQLKTNAVLDQATKSSYTICVRSTDNGVPPLSVDKQLTITVGNTNDAPTDIALSASSVAENLPAGTTIGALTTTDPDAGDTHTYTLLAASASCPGTNDTTGFQIGTGADADKLQTAKSFNFESDPTSYLVCVRTTDSGSPALHFDKQFTITITNANDPPTDIGISPASIDENKPSGSQVGTLSATDPDPGQTFTYSFATTCAGTLDNASFAIVGDKLNSAASFDFETKSSYDVCVRVTDSGSPAASFDKKLTVAVNNVNDPPVAGAASFGNAIGNTKLAVGTSSSGPVVSISGNLLTGVSDQDVPAQTLSVVAETVSSAGGGTATINGDGSFVYLPGPGDKNQTDTFTYHATDGQATSAGTVTITIANALVWYVDNAANPATPDGRSTSPYTSLASLQGAGDPDGPGDIVFLYQGASTYGGGLPLEDGQNLFGQPHGLTVNNGISNVALVAASGANPTITNAAGTGITLGQGNDVEAVNVASTNGAGIAGTSVNAATIGTANTVAVTGSGGIGVDLNGGSGTIDVAASISGSVGDAVRVQNRTGGTTTFSGAITGTSGGIVLAANTGATLAFTGGVGLSTGGNPAFAATGGGTVSVTGSANTLATTTGTALNVSSTTIGAGGLTFRSIASNGAANGIVLDATGASGGLTVAGTGAAGSGGTIQNSTGSGIKLTGVGGGVSLTQMVVTGNGDALNEHGLDISGASGTISLASDNVSNNADSNVNVTNASGSLTLNVTNGTYSGAGPTLTGKNRGIEVEGTGTGSQTVDIEGATFSNNRGDHIQVTTDNSNSVAQTVTINGITATTTPIGTAAVLGGGIAITPGGGATVTSTITNNSIQGKKSDGAIRIDTTSGSAALPTTAIVKATISNNTIGTAATARSGNFTGDGIEVFANGEATVTALIANNLIHQYTTTGIRLLQGDGHSAKLNATVRGNTLDTPSTALGGAVGVGVQSGLTSTPADGTAADAGIMCLDLGGAGSLQNALATAGTDVVGSGYEDINVVQAFGGEVDMPFLGGDTTDAAAAVYLQNRNQGNGVPDVYTESGANVGGTPDTGFKNINSSCPTP